MDFLLLQHSKSHSSRTLLNLFGSLVSGIAFSHRTLWVLCFGALLAGATSAPAQTLTWTGAGDGVSFGSALNWSPAVSPGPTHDCVIPSGAQTIVAPSSLSIRSLSTARNINLTGCSQMTVTAGIMLNTGAIIRIDNSAGCTGITFNGSVQSLSGDGQIVVVDEGQGGYLFSLQNGAKVTIAPGVTVSFSPTAASKIAYINIQSLGSLTNLGVLAVAHPSATLNVMGAGSFVNSGTLRATSGTLAVTNATGDIGKFAFGAGGSIYVSGNYAVSAPVNLPASTRLTLAGTWSSTAPFWATDATLNFAGTWSHTGGTLLGNTTWSLDGSYSSIGAVERIGGAISLSGSYSGPVLAANASTGSMTLAVLTLAGTTLTSADGASFLLVGASNFNACTVDAPLAITSCGSVSVTGGLTLTSNGKLSTTQTCSTAALSFNGGVQSVSGSGSIYIASGSSSPALLFTQSSTVTFGAGLTLSVGTEFAGAEAAISIDAGSKCINFAPVTIKKFSTLTISGAGTFESRAPITAFASSFLNIKPASWLNAAPISATDSTLTLAGAFDSLGSITRTGGSLTVSGTYLGSSIVATDATGDITLSGLATNNTLLSATPGRKLLSSGGLNLNACTLATDLVIQGCPETLITGGLTLANASTLNVGDTSSCSPYSGLVFSGGPQTLGGSGTILLRRGSSAESPSIRLKNNANVSIGPGVTVSAGATSNSSYITIEAGCTLTNLGTILANYWMNITGAGTFSNQGLLHAANYNTVISTASWFNTGTFRVSNGATLNLQGSYSSLGTIDRQGGTIIVGGSFSGQLLEASAGTGDLALGSSTYVNTTLAASGGAKFTVISDLVLDGCTIDASMTVLPCATVHIRNGLTLSTDARLIVDFKTGYNLNCGTPFYFEGTQSVQGSGEIVVNDAADRMCASITGTLTLFSGITLRMGPDSDGQKHISGLVLESGATLINEGTIAVRQANKVFHINASDVSASFVNAGTFECIAGNLNINTASWTNTGNIALSGTGTIKLGGTYSSLGPITRSGGTLTLTGTYTGASLTADASTGDLVLGGVILESTKLFLTPGFNITTTGVQLNNGTIDGNFDFTRCATVVVRGDLVLTNNAVIAFSGLGSCGTGSSGMSFGSTPSQIRGNGEIHLNACSVSTSGTLTIAPTISISAGTEIPNANCSFSGPLVNWGSILANSGGSFVIAGTFTNLGSVAATSGTLEIRALSGATGLLAIGTAASLVLAGNFNINNPIDIAPGRSLLLSGTWTNNSAITVTGGTVWLVGTWVNAGSITISGSQLTLGGTYSSLGNFTSTSNQLIYTGTVPASTIIADNTTGDISFNTAYLNNVILQSSGGAKFRVIGTNLSNFKGCTVGGNVVIGDCGRLAIQNGITLIGGAEISIENSAANCSSYPLMLSGAAQVLTGHGAIRVLHPGNAPAIYVAGGPVEIDSGVEVLIDVQDSVGYASILVEGAASLINKSIFSVLGVGSQLTITGPGTFVNQGLLHASAWSSLSIANLSGPLGAVSLDPAASLILAGTYSISDPLAISGGGGLNLSGTWTNNSTISVDHATLLLGGTWTNAGTLNVSNSAWTIGGTYASLGNNTGASNSLTYAGTFPGPILEANATTGDITLSTVTLNNTILRTRDNARINLGLGAAVTMSQCRIETDLRFTFCSTLSINKGLTLADGSTLTFDNAFCNRAAITFTGTTQSVTGLGKFSILDAGTANAITNSVSTSSTVTIGPDVELAFGPTPASSPAPASNFTIAIGTSRTLVNQGAIASNIPGKIVTISGGTFQNSGTIESAAGTISITAALSNYVANVTRLTGGRWIMSGGSLSLGTSVINNIGAGTEFRFTSPAGTTPNLSALFQNSGTVVLANRTLAITPAGGKFTNSGTLELDANGHLNVTGEVNLDPSSNLHVPLTGLGPTSHGRVTSTGTTSLAGKLGAAFKTPYIPQSGDVTSPILTAPSLVGAFASVCADGNPASLGVQPLLDSANVPNSFALLVAGSSGLTPLITQQPADTNASPNAIFSCAASPADASFKWFRNGLALQNGPTGHGSTISGASSSVLTIASAASADAGLYTCAATNSCGTTLSTPARLSVCTGDFNADGLVDDSDFQVFVAGYNLLDCSDPAMPTDCPADLDRSGAVDDADFPLFIVSYDALLCP